MGHLSFRAGLAVTLRLVTKMKGVCGASFALLGILSTVSRRTELPRLPCSLVLYAPCLFARQLGFYQGIPSILPYLAQNLKEKTSDDDIEESKGHFRHVRSVVSLDANQAPFMTWWRPIFDVCVPTRGIISTLTHFFFFSR
ncbi:hypothetical protein M5689_020959 [Euphorbia peplus]|nr:hypothetical protein M5689_020959 [Euphorbia peplus]